jgi:hypothetical protein
MKASIIANPGTVMVPGRAPIVLAPPPVRPAPPVARFVYDNPPPVRAVRPETNIIASTSTVDIPGREPMVLERPVLELPWPRMELAVAPAPTVVVAPPAGLPALSVGIVGAPNTTVSNTPANLWINPLTNITDFIVVDLDAGVY